VHATAECIVGMHAVDVMSTRRSWVLFWAYGAWVAADKMQRWRNVIPDWH
jgi:hypothetical protein